MPEQSESAQRKTAAKSDKAIAKARDDARADRSRLVVESALAEEAQMHATIDAVNARIEAMNAPAEESKEERGRITVSGNQGRPE